VYDWTFEHSRPPAHLLLRDYARGIIELAANRGVVPETVDIKRALPPYRSQWPLAIPDEDSAKPRISWRKEVSEDERGELLLYGSLADMGDFARYIVPKVNCWVNRRLGETQVPSRRQMYRRFINSLTARQQTSWATYQSLRRARALPNVELDSPSRADVTSAVPTLTEGQWSSTLAHYEHMLRRSLGKRKSRAFEEIVKPYLEEGSEEDSSLDSSAAQHWILNRVFELGWTRERFGRFDSMVDRIHNQGRSADKPERIGKKYQWIAYFELLAHLADNLEFRGHSWSERLYD